MSDHALQWYLVYTKVQKERVAYEQLCNQSYHAFLPLLPVKKRVRGVYQSQVLPMFPRYVFVSLDSGRDDFSPIRSTIGVSHMVRFGSDYARVPHALVDMLQQRPQLAASGDKVTDALFNKGDNVCVLDGPLKGFEGVFQAQKGLDRVVLLLKMANQFTSVQLPLDAVGAA